MSTSKAVTLPTGALVTLRSITMNDLSAIRRDAKDPKDDATLTAILAAATVGWTAHPHYGAKGAPAEKTWHTAFDIDRTKAMMEVRLLTYGAAYLRNFICGSCERPYVTQFHAVDDFPITDWPEGTLDTISAGGYPQIAIALEDGTPVRMLVRIPSPTDRDRARSLILDGGDVTAIEAMTGRIVKAWVGVGEDPTQDELEAAKGAPVPGKTRVLYVPEQIREWLGELGPVAFADIIDAANAVFADVDTQCVTVCTHCRKHNEVIVPLDDTYFNVPDKPRKPRRVIGAKTSSIPSSRTEELESIRRSTSRSSVTRRRCGTRSFVLRGIRTEAAAARSPTPTRKRFRSEKPYGGFRGSTKSAKRKPPRLPGKTRKRRARRRSGKARLDGWPI